VLAYVESAGDVAVGDASREPHFLPEALEHLRRREEVAVKNLERDDVSQLPVERAIDATHPAGPEQALDLVPARDHRRCDFGDRRGRLVGQQRGIRDAHHRPEHRSTNQSNHVTSNSSCGHADGVQVWCGLL
jgi:hypothetical protein